jgi:NAD(P)H-dependent FMN reductase
MTKIAIITGSTRPGRVNRQVADWVLANTGNITGATFEIVDIADFNLPLLDEGYPAMYQNYSNDHTKNFSKRIAEFDAFIFVVAEYNHTIAPALTNAISYINVEFNNKAAGIVSYGSAMGVRAAEHLRNVLSELQVAHVQRTVMFNLFTDFEQFTTFKPTEINASQLQPMLDQLLPWAHALKTVRG